MLAIKGAEEVQVPPDVAENKVVVPPAHMDKEPAMVAGAGEIVTLFVAKQPGTE